MTLTKAFNTTVAIARKKILEDALKKLEPTYTLIYINHNDQFSTKQLIDGWESFEKLYDSIDCWESDTRYEATREIIKEMLDEEEFDILDGSEEYDELRFAIEERDDSNPIKELLIRSENQWLFMPLETDRELTGTTGISEEDKLEDMKSIARALGVEFTQYEKEIRELYENASYGGTLGILACEPVDDLIYRKEEIAALTFENPHICIRDTWNGSGHDVQFNGIEIRVPIDHEDSVIFDESARCSYAVDVCGLVKEPYSGTMDFEFKKSN